EEERPGHAVLTRGGVVEARLHTTDRGALDLVLVLIEEAVAEDAEGVWICIELLDDEIVVLARLDVGAVLAELHAGLAFEPGFLRTGHFLAARLPHELGERVPRASSGRRPEHLDRDIRDVRIDVAPVPVGVPDPLAVHRNPLGA